MFIVITAATMTCKVYLSVNSCSSFNAVRVDPLLPVIFEAESFTLARSILNFSSRAFRI
jgi:hypothetical protein